jgi:hypothetical protein
MTPDKLTFDEWLEEYVNLDVVRKNMLWCCDPHVEEIFQPLYEEYLKNDS